MPRKTIVDPEALLNDALAALQSEIKQLKATAAAGDVLDPEEQSKRLNRAISSSRNLVKEVRELQKEQRAEFNANSETELMKLLLKRKAGKDLVLGTLQELGYVVEEPRKGTKSGRKGKRSAVLPGPDPGDATESQPEGEGGPGSSDSPSAEA